MSADTEYNRTERCNFIVTSLIVNSGKLLGSHCEFREVISQHIAGLITSKTEHPNHFSVLPSATASRQVLDNVPFSFRELHDRAPNVDIFNIPFVNDVKLSEDINSCLINKSRIPAQDSREVPVFQRKGVK